MKIPSYRRKRSAGFTMVEIAIALGVIVFAMVAIIGVLPLGFNVQRENREDTILNQEGLYFLEAMRSGATGLDRLTNYVEFVAIKRVGAGQLEVHTNPALPGILPKGTPMQLYGDLTNGARILGLLSQPRVLNDRRATPRVNDVYAQVRAMTGSAAEQGSGDLAFRYKVVSTVTPFIHFPVDSTNYTAYAKGSEDRTVRYQRLEEASQLRANLYELRLSFQWPLLPNGQVGRSRQVFRTLVSSQQTQPIPLKQTDKDWLFLPQTYANAPTNGL